MKTTEEYCFDDGGFTFDQLKGYIEFMDVMEVNDFRMEECDYLFEGKVVSVNVEGYKVGDGRYEFHTEGDYESPLFTVYVEEDGSMSIVGGVSRPLYEFVSHRKDENGEHIIDLEGWKSQFN